MSTQAGLFSQRDWIEDDKILHYSIFSVNQQMMQDWSLDILAALRHWPENHPPRFLFDLAHPNVSMSYFVLARRELFNLGITAEGQSQVQYYLEQYPQRPVKLALIVSITMLGTLSKYMPTRYQQENFFAKIFFEPHAAVQWLLARHETNEVSTGTETSKNILSTDEYFNVDSAGYYGERNQLRLLVNGSLEVLPIDEARPIIVGRHPLADLNLHSYGELARSVSRNHAQISITNGHLSIMDLKSRNGTFLSGRQLEAGKAAFIGREDIIKVGQVEIKVVF